MATISAYIQEPSEEVLSVLTSKQELELDGMIRDVPPASASTINRTPDHRSLGRLDELPAELLLPIFDLLDFRSLSRLSQVCLQAKETVEAQSVYQQTMQLAPTLLTAMGKTRLLSVHSGPTVLGTLRSDRCVSCHDFGGFIFLPTCERICFECLRENEAFWMITTTFAEKCFCLTRKQLRTIPIAHTISGTYSVGGQVSRRKERHHLVSVKQAKQLVNKLLGDFERIEALKAAEGESTSLITSGMFQRFREVSLEPPLKDLSKRRGRAALGGDSFAGVASMRVPSFSGTVPDWGRICQGCQLINNLFEDGHLDSSIVRALVPRGVPKHRPLEAATTRLHSKERFPQHVLQCYGAPHFIRE